MKKCKTCGEYKSKKSLPQGRTTCSLCYQYSKKKSCLDCGKLVINTSTRCHACANKEIGKHRRGRDKERERQRVKQWGDANKEKWIEIIAEKFGGYCCSLCEYDKCLAAIDFHHNDPSKKDFNLGSKIRTLPTDEKIKELDKGMLLCSNCHRELHWRIAHA